MKKLFYLLLLSSISIFAQNFQWVDFPTITSTNNTNGNSYLTTCDNLGNVYCVGFRDNQFNNGAVYGHLFYRKYNTNGILIFDKTISGKVRVINLTSDSVGNVYFVGAYRNTITFDNGAGTTNAGTTEIPIVVKFDSNGTFLWNQNISNFGAFNHFSAIATDANNNVYIGIDDFNNSKIIKLSGADSTTLMTIDQLNVQIISSLSIDSLGNIFAAGSCGTPNSVFAGISQPTSLDYSVYAVKYNPNGNHQWTKFVQDTSCRNPQICAATPTDIYFSSTLTGAYAFGSFITTLGPSSGSSDDIFISKLSIGGNFVWVREVAGTGKASVGRNNFLRADASGNVYLVGTTRATTVWNPTITTTVTGFGDDALILKYNSIGDLLMAKKFGGQSSDKCDSVALDNSGNIYVAGITSGAVTFDAISNSVGTNVPFIAKIGSILGINSIDSDTTVLHPNPAQNELFVSNINHNKGFIYNTLGQKMKNFEIKNTSSIDISDLSNGIYFIQFEGKKTLKFIKN